MEPVEEVAGTQMVLTTVHIEEVMLDNTCVLVSWWRHFTKLFLFHPTDSFVILPDVVEVKAPESLRGSKDLLEPAPHIHR